MSTDDDLEFALPPVDDRPIGDLMEEYRVVHAGEPEPGWLRRWFDAIGGSA